MSHLFKLISMCRKGALHRTDTNITLRKENLSVAESKASLCPWAVFQTPGVNVMAVDLMIHVPFLLCSCISDCRPVAVSSMFSSGDISLDLVENVVFCLLKYSDPKSRRVLTEAAECIFKSELVGIKNM